MPFQPNVVVWGSLSSACWLHGEVELGELATKHILELDPGHDGAYVLLSNVYAKAGRWGDVGGVRRLVTSQAVWKARGCSWTELDGEVHEFLLMGDETHPRSIEIYEKLDEVVKELEIAGYNPHLRSVLVDLEEEEKRRVILLIVKSWLFHLGLSVLLKVQAFESQRIFSFMKLASKVFEREIIARDRTRFHHYRDGVCSCGDFR